MRKDFLTLDPAHIVLLEGDGNYTLVCCVDGQMLLTSITLKKYELFLKEKAFVRLNKTYLINPTYVAHVIPQLALVVLCTGHKITASRRKKSLLQQLKSPILTKITT